MEKEEKDIAITEKDPIDFDGLYATDIIGSHVLVSASELTPEQMEMWRAINEREIKEAWEEGFELVPMLADPKDIEAEYHYKFDKVTAVIDGEELEMTAEEFDRRTDAEFWSFIEAEEKRRQEAEKKLPKVYDDPEIAAIFRPEKRARDYIFEELKNCGYKTDKELYKKAGVAGPTFVRASNARTSKATLIEIGVTLGFDAQKLNEVLMSEGFVLSPNLTWDKAIRYCLKHGYKDVKAINNFLQDHGLVTLSEAKKRPSLCKI